MSWDRHSKAETVELIADPVKKAEREAENGVRQYKDALEIVRGSIHQASPFKLNQAIILRLHEKALAGIHPLAGTYRNSPVEIGSSKHMPPRHTDVPDLVGEMCAHVNSLWDERGAIPLAAYVLWRMNWIHPFADGNGRTARVLSYVVLSTKLNSILPGSPTIPDQIASDKRPYYKALEEADESWKLGRIALSGMEAMLEQMLANQLLQATQEAAI
ncbi:MAG: Fic family protein [Bauldia sp.]|nr:Fic family protein [Bauldia sp.]